jgi:hypothetical protein
MESNQHTVTMVIRVPAGIATVDLPLALNDKVITGMRLVNYTIDVPLVSEFIQLRFGQGFKVECLTSGVGLRSDAIIIPVGAFATMFFMRPINVSIGTRKFPRVFTVETYDDQGALLAGVNITFHFEVDVASW